MDYLGALRVKDRCSVVELLTVQLVKPFGAPDLATARMAAEEEIDFVVSIDCNACVTACKNENEVPWGHQSPARVGASTECR